MQPKSPYSSVIGRFIPTLTVWTLGKILTIDSVQKRTKAFDRKAHKKKEEVVSGVRRAGRNAVRNGAWTAASAAAFALSIGLLAKATRGK